MWPISLSLVITAITVLYFWLKYKFEYWKKRGIKGPTPTVPFGNFKSVALFQERLEPKLHQIYIEYSHEPVVGLFAGIKPVLLVKDPVLIKQILVKDSNIFQDRGISVAVNKNSLFFSEGAHWHVSRKNFSPVFSPTKLKSMYLLVQKCAEDYLKLIETSIHDNLIQEMGAQTRIFVINSSSSCLFGVDITNDEKIQDKCIALADLISRFGWRIIMRVLLNIIIPGFDKLFVLFGARTQSYQADVFFKSIISKVMHEREQNSEKRNDLVGYLMTLKYQEQILKEVEPEKLRDIKNVNNLLVIQAATFFGSSIKIAIFAINVALYEMALNQDIQEKAYEEVMRIKKKYNGFTYESVHEMTFLTMIIEETLRLYSPLGLLRTASEDFTFSGTNIKIDKDTPVMIPTGALQRDPQYFENPNVFDPDRFSSENKKIIPPFVYMPFGDGPRHCIGMRFGKMVISSGLANFLSCFKVEPSNKTERPLKMSPFNIHFEPLSGIWLKISRRN